MGRFKNRGLISLIVLVTALAAVGCGSSDSSSSSGGSDSSSSNASNASGGGSSDETLRVGVLAGFALKPLLEASGEGKGVDYQIEWQEMPGAGPQWLEFARAGSTDLGTLTETPLLLGQAADTPAKAIAAKEWMAPGESLVEVVVHPDSGIKTFADLKGKKVSAVEGQYQQYYLAKALEKEGMSFDDIQVVQLQQAEAATAFEAGQIDAAVVADPALTPLLANGNESIAGSDEVLPPPLEFWTATDSAIESKTAVLEDFLERMERAEKWADSHPAEWSKIYAETFEVEPAVAREIVERQKTNYIPMDRQVFDWQQEEADTFVKLGILPEPLEVKEEFDTEFNGPSKAAGE